MSSTETLQPDKDAVLYLIDGSYSMRSTGALTKVLVAVVSSILLIQRRGDRRFDVGVVLYGSTNKDPSRSKFADVDVLMRVSDPKIADLKKIIALIDSGVPGKPRPAAGTTKSSITNALQQTKLEMASLNPTAFRRLVLITDDDKPPDLRRAQSLTRDLTDLNVLTVPTFLEHDGSSFDPSLFWQHMVYLPPSLSMASRNSQLSVSLHPCNIDKLPVEFSFLVQSKTERKLPTLRGELVVQNMLIGITGYSIVSRPSPPKKVAVSAHLSKYSSTEANDYDGAAGDTDTEEQKCFVLGANQVVPCDDDDGLYRLRPDSRSSKLHIHGFVSVDELKSFSHRELFVDSKVGAPLLIVPSNYVWENSKAAFASLHRSMTRKRRVAWATLASRSGTKARTYGLLYSFDPNSATTGPQVELKPNTRNGMYFVPVACNDDLRHLKAEESNIDRHNAENNPDLVGLVQKLVRRFSVAGGFDPTQFPHPRRVQFANVLESIALDLDMPHHETPDATLPDYERIAKVSHLAMEINDNLVAVKDDTTSKKRKQTDLGIFREAHSIGRLSVFTVPELKWALGELHLVATGKKGELVARLAQYL